MAHDLTQFQLPSFDVELEIDGEKQLKRYDPFEVMFKLKMSMGRVFEPTGDMEVLKDAEGNPVLDDNKKTVKVPVDGLSKILKAFDEGTTDQLPPELPPLDVVLANVSRAFDLEGQSMFVLFAVLKTFTSDMQVLALLKKAMRGLRDSCKPSPELLQMLNSTQDSDSAST